MYNFSQKAGAQKRVVRDHQTKSFVLLYRLAYLDQRRIPVTARLDDIIWEQKSVKLLQEETLKKPEIVQIL